MKVCIVFRGESVRTQHSADTSRKYIDILMCWDNIKKTIFDDLINLGDSCDIAFVTYPSNILEKIKEIINPKYLHLYKQETQSKNFEDVIRFMTEHVHDYDRFIILRCDFQYRMCISTWPNWIEKGIFIVNKDVHWPTLKLYGDVLFIVDSFCLNDFKTAFDLDKMEDSLHGIGRYLYSNNIPFHLMYEDYYHMNSHPLHSMASLENSPDLENPLHIEPIIDVSKWN
jgi:hypothetical protein